MDLSLFWGGPLDLFYLQFGDVPRFCVSNQFCLVCFGCQFTEEKENLRPTKILF